MKKIILAFLSLLFLVNISLAADYVPSTTCTDHSGTAAGCMQTLMTAIGGTKNATILLKHASGNRTTYALTANSVTGTSNIKIVAQQGVRISTASGKTMTIGGDFEGPWGVFTGSGSVEFATLATVDAKWFIPTGQPDGTTDNSAAVQKAINSLTSSGGKVKLPWSANAYRLNITLPANVKLEGDSPHMVVVKPYTEANPVIAVTGARVTIRNLNLAGVSAATSMWGIRHNRALDGSGGGLVVEDNRIEDFNRGIDINNNYYNVIQRNSFDDITYGVYGRNAFNRSTIRDNKFSGFDYAIAVFYAPGTDANRSHGLTIQDNSFEGPNVGGIGEYYYNTGGHVSLHNYYEGFAAKYIHLDVAPAVAWEAADTITGQSSGASARIVSKISDTMYCITGYSGTFTLGEVIGVTGEADKLADQGAANPIFSSANFPVVETHGPIVGWHRGTNNSATLVDKYGRDFTKLGVTVGMTVYNKTDGTNGAITAIGNENTTNDKLTITLAGTGDKDWDIEDYFLVDTDDTVEFRGGNTFINPHLNSQIDADEFLKGANRLVSSIHGSWTVSEAGALSLNKISSADITANTPYEIDLSSQISAYSRISLGRIKVSYTFVNSDGTAGYLTFRPVGGGANDYYGYHNFDASSTISETIELPIDPYNRFWFHSNRNGTLTVRIHGMLRE